MHINRVDWSSPSVQTGSEHRYQVQRLKCLQRTFKLRRRIGMWMTNGWEGIRWVERPDAKSVPRISQEVQHDINGTRPVRWLDQLCTEEMHPLSWVFDILTASLSAEILLTEILGTGPERFGISRPSLTRSKFQIHYFKFSRINRHSSWLASARSLSSSYSVIIVGGSKDLLHV